MGAKYLAFDQPDAVVINIGDIIFARALEEFERRGMKENFRTFVQFRSGRVHYLYVDYTEFLTAFTAAINASAGVETREEP